MKSAMMRGATNRTEPEQDRPTAGTDGLRSPPRRRLFAGALMLPGLWLLGRWPWSTRSPCGGPIETALRDVPSAALRRPHNLAG